MVMEESMVLRDRNAGNSLPGNGSNGSCNGAGILRTSPANMLGGCKENVPRAMNQPRAAQTVPPRRKPRAPVLATGDAVVDNAFDVLDGMGRVGREQQWEPAQVERLEHSARQTQAAVLALHRKVEATAKALVAEKKQVSTTQQQQLRRRSERDALRAAIEPLPPWRCEAQHRCFHCGDDFGWLSRKSHCRGCGNVFHRGCADDVAELPQFGYKGGVRVCKMCCADARVAKAKAEKLRLEREAQAQAQAQAQTPGLTGHGLRRPNLLQSALLAHVKSSSKTSLNKGLRRANSDSCPSTPPGSGSGTAPDKPRTVLDELRQSLKKRNSSPHLLAKNGQVDKHVQETRSASFRHRSSHSCDFMLPKEGTPIRGLLNRAKTEQDASQPASPSEW